MPSTLSTPAQPLRDRLPLPNAHPRPSSPQLPREYIKCIDNLKARQESALVIQATNELGDVYAHFG